MLARHSTLRAHDTLCVCIPAQVSAALNPENEAAKAFQECCLIRHPRHGEYAFGFVTGKTSLSLVRGWVAYEGLKVHRVYLVVSSCSCYMITLAGMLLH